MGIMHDEHSLIIENGKQFHALRMLMFMLWEFELMDNYDGNYILDEIDWMWGSTQRLNKADKCL